MLGFAMSLGAFVLLDLQTYILAESFPEVGASHDRAFFDASGQLFLIEILLGLVRGHLHAGYEEAFGGRKRAH